MNYFNYALIVMVTLLQKTTSYSWEGAPLPLLKQVPDILFYCTELLIS